MRFRFMVLSMAALGCLLTFGWRLLTQPQQEAGHDDTNNVAAGTVGEVLPTIQVQVSGVKPNAGIIRVAVFDQHDGFPDHEQAITRITIQPDAESVSAEIPFDDERCAVAVFQDTDDNGELTKGALGVPKERYGFSNKARGTFGPPSFEDASIHSDEQIEVSLK